MFAPNEERRRRIEQMYSLGFTIDEISLFERIHRSTVGYYVKRFRRQSGITGNRPRRFQKPPTTQPLSDEYRVAAAFLLVEVRSKLRSLFEKGEYEKASKLLEALERAEKFEGKMYGIMGAGEPITLERFMKALEAGIIPPTLKVEQTHERNQSSILLDETAEHKAPGKSLDEILGQQGDR